ncbi:MAG: membrane protein [marine bacterium B5-7]|nr:MAG: membrane protein [marine bacterium B5-7]
MKYALIILFICVGNVFAADNESLMTEYAKGFKLTTEEQSAIYKIALPELVYSTVVQKDLSDIRIFNRDFQPVPHTIQQPKIIKTKKINSLELPYFPMATRDINLENHALDITVASKGEVVRIQTTGDVSELNKYYLIDTSHINTPIDSIDFTLKGLESGYAKEFRLDYSNDLNQWETLIEHAILTELKYGQYALKNTRIKLPHKNIKYIRFTWLSDADELVITSVKANFKDEYLSGNRHWSTSSLISKNIDEATYVFDTGGVFNIEQIDIELPEDNMLIDVIIESRARKDSSWKKRFVGVFYKLYFEEIEFSGEPVSVEPNKDRYWQIRFQSKDGIGNDVPVLKYAWRPDYLYFLARGNAPYTLAFGNAHVDVNNHAVSRLMSILDQDVGNEMMGLAKIGEEIILKGAPALIEQKTLPWERIVLWAVLITGVIVIATMVIRLARNMGDAGGV